MAHSMTAFARGDITASWGNAFWEIRSVNHRYLETFIRLPDHMRAIEPIIRDKLRAKITRGKIECQLKIDKSSETIEGFNLNEALAKQLITAANWLKEQTIMAEIDPLKILSWPGVMQTKEQDTSQITTDLLAEFDNTLENFIAVRQTEGTALTRLMISRLDEIDIHINKIKQQMPSILKWQKNKILEKFKEANIDYDPYRIEQELILLAQKIDVAEELDRLSTHIKEIRSILNNPAQAVGRRLDFMMQELNRESNTIASKSINADVTASAIELKVLIEQMREQIQNLE